MRPVIRHIPYFLLLPFVLFGQEAELADNIIPNPGFEKYSSTPIGWFYNGNHFSSVMKYWFSATTASPDVFGPKVRVPAQWAAKGFGEQEARSGESMIGITTYGCENGKPHCREYIEIQLKEPLVIGQQYYAEFWTTHLPRSLRVNNLGMHFSVEKLQKGMDVLLDVQPQVLALEVVDAPGKWVKISGEFTATSEGEFLTIGNFFFDPMTKIKTDGANHLNFAYYYIDDVLLRKKHPIIPVPVKEDDLSNITITEGMLYTLKDIFFDTDRSELLPRSYIELDKLVALMKKHPNMVIEVNGHTDDRGGERYNMALSKKRARSVVDYLMEKGIAAKRTQFEGFGSTQPLATNDTEAGRQLNRRVTFLVLQK
jgi:OmpA-OmpF porin, OOP family